ncbi:MAG: GDP-mannose 4,6-dehydratase [Caldilineaceae bacterium]
MPLPVYGDGQQMRDYQYVMDHCEGIDLVLHQGTIGEVSQHWHRRRDEQPANG